MNAGGSSVAIECQRVFEEDIPFQDMVSIVNDLECSKV